MGLVDENGVMTDNFTVGDSDLGSVEDLLSWKNESRGGVEEEGAAAKVVVEKFKVCDSGMVDYVPCLDNAEAVARLNGSERGEKYERHCPEEGKGLNCLVPRPQGYRVPILWPQSRDEVLFGFGLFMSESALQFSSSKMETFTLIVEISIYSKNSDQLNLRRDENVFNLSVCLDKR